MKITHDYIRRLITYLDYTKQNAGVWQKQYKKHNNYIIQIDFNSEKIIYPAPLLLGDETTSNFESSENFVVLECVNRLLEKGYNPSSLSLEHKWSLGRQNKGKLDILVKDKNDKAYLMIECKTWGNEFSKEKNRMIKDGGQLFSYYQQDKNASYLCLYTSQLTDDLEYKSHFIKITEEYKQANNTAEALEHWNKQFLVKGIFESNIKPYYINDSQSLKRKDLEALNKDSSRGIYNEFREILRHSAVSDTANAFNKMFNLFLCKVVDENKNEEEELYFQWKSEDTAESLFDRLNTLYKNGMEQYLHKKITDYSEQDILDNAGNNQALQRMIKEMRLYKNQDFAFTEVYNEQSFNINASIVKKVVQLLQGNQIRYQHKQQFLGEFFELLIGAGFKQENGQFFTPVPLTRFIINSLPLKDIIEKKINSGVDDFLPYSIDFACGSGHFLTELMDELQKEINTLDAVNMKPSQKNKLASYKKEGFEWAKEFIYGIEKDYRLVKTTKLACFLHGDGEAQIIHASGLDPFYSDDYLGKLKNNKTNNSGNNEEFDILIANPPYSVDGFISTISDYDKNFSCYDSFSDKDGDIELLFIERMKQLVKPGGYAAIILPPSVLDNDKPDLIRRLIFEYFEFKAVVKLGKNTFMATNSETVILFLKKRSIKLSLLSKQDYKEMCKNQKVLVINSGDKEVEKSFLGYQFFTRRGSEGIKPYGDGLLTNNNDKEDNTKASSYVLKHLQNKTITNIDHKLKDNIYLMNMVDCFDFERKEFKNNVKLKKKLLKSSKYDLFKLGDVCNINKGNSLRRSIGNKSGTIPIIAGGTKANGYHDTANYEQPCITVSASGTAGYVWYHDEPVYATDCLVLTPKQNVNLKYVSYVLRHIQDEIYSLRRGGKGVQHVYEQDLLEIMIPLPPLHIQLQVVTEIDNYQQQIDNVKKRLIEITNIINQINFHTINKIRLNNNCFNLSIGKRIIKHDEYKKPIENSIPVYSANVCVPSCYTTKRLLNDFSVPSVMWGIDGNWQVNYIAANIPFYPTDHLGVLRCNDENINKRYLAYALEKAGNEIGFSRTLRASIERISQIEIPLPAFEEQSKLGDLLSQKELLEIQYTEVTAKVEQSKERILSAL